MHAIPTLTGFAVVSVSRGETQPTGVQWVSDAKCGVPLCCAVVPVRRRWTDPPSLDPVSVPGVCGASMLIKSSAAADSQTYPAAPVGPWMRPRRGAKTPEQVGGRDGDAPWGSWPHLEAGRP